MRVRNKCLIDTNHFLVIFLVAVICVAIPLALTFLVPYPFNMIGIALLVIYWLINFLFFFSWLIYPLGYNIVDETGITRRFLFLKKHYNWSDLKFISKTRTYGRLECVIEKI